MNQFYSLPQSLIRPQISVLSGLLCMLLLLSTATTAQRPFVTTWRTASAGEQISIPTRGTQNNYQVDWSYDGTNFNNEGNYTENAMHTYATAGDHRIAIIGDFTNIQLLYSENANRILSIDQWGDIEWSTMELAFVGCENLGYTATDAPDLSKVTSMQNMFLDSKSFNGAIGNWNTETITSMQGMFTRAKAFNQDLNNWNTSNVVDMDNMFLEASAFNGNISNWNTGKVETMIYMFSDAIAFNQAIGDWNISNAKRLDALFLNAKSFNQDIGKWNTENVESMSSMFSRATAFNQDISSWNLANVRTMFGMFMEATSFNQNLGSWIFPQARDLVGIFADCGLSTSNYDQTLAGWYNEYTPSNITVGATGLFYSEEGKVARQKLIDDYNWTFIGDALGMSSPTLDYSSNSETVRVYPNPATNQLNLSHNVLSNITVIDELGRDVLQVQPEAKTLDISMLPNGTYYLRSSRGNEGVIVRFIKH